MQMSIPAKAIRGKDLRKMTVDELAALAGCMTAQRRKNKGKRQRDYFCPSPSPVPVNAIARLPEDGLSYATEHMKSQLEVDYAAYLESLRHAGKILIWEYERISLRLGDNTTYKPDFLVILPDGHMELHETKGYWREKDWIKFKTAAAMNPWFTFVNVMRKDGIWTTRKYKPEGITNEV